MVPLRSVMTTVFALCCTACTSIGTRLSSFSRNGNKVSAFMTDLPSSEGLLPKLPLCGNECQCPLEIVFTDGRRQVRSMKSCSEEGRRTRLVSSVFKTINGRSGALVLLRQL